jgi:hypothetical protein
MDLGAGATAQLRACWVSDGRERQRGSGWFCDAVTLPDATWVKSESWPGCRDICAALSVGQASATVYDWFSLRDPARRGPWLLAVPTPSFSSSLIELQFSQSQVS